MRDLSNCSARAVAEAFGDTKPDALHYSDPIVYAMALQEWHLRQYARLYLEQKMKMKRTPLLRYQFDGVGEGENR